VTVERRRAPGIAFRTHRAMSSSFTPQILGNSLTRVKSCSCEDEKKGGAEAPPDTTYRDCFRTGSGSRS
jgi:hypothetical protein